MIPKNDAGSAKNRVILPEIPTTWIATSFGCVFAYIQRGKSPKYIEHSALPVVNQKCVRWDTLQTEFLKFVDPIQWEQWTEERYLREGDILWNSTGTGTIGRAHLFRQSPKLSSCVVDSHVTILRTPPSIESKFAFYFVMSPYVQKAINDMQNGSTNQVELGKATIKASAFPLAPHAEQKRIVSKIDELFSKIDEGEANLKRVEALVKQYRQSVLKAAVTGELTRDWRAKNAGNTESGEDLLKRILETRRAAWEEAELAKMRAKGKEPTNDKWKEKYVQPAAPDTTNLPDLPDGWVWASIAQLCDVWIGSTPSRQEPKYWGGNIPWVSSGEVAFCRIKDTREAITDLGLANSSTQLHPKGTVLLAMIGEGKTRGQAAILDVEATNNQNAAAIRLFGEDIPPEYLFFCLMERYEQTRRAGRGGNQPALNKALVGQIALPLPPGPEIRVICAQLELAIASCEMRRLELISALRSNAALRDSVLKVAFSGKLVPQDPDDEPASVLLERIASERSAAAVSTSQRKRESKREDRVAKAT